MARRNGAGRRGGALRAVVVALAVAGVAAQQAGSLTPNFVKPLAISRCAAGGQCTTEATTTTLDANWRWLHDTGGYTNCYTGNSWDSSLCPDPVTCSANCALEGVDAAGLQNTYGTAGGASSLELGYVTGNNVGSRHYLVDESDSSRYKMFHLKNREFTFDVDVSNMPCGVNGALYFVEMPADGGASFAGNSAGANFGTGYCDAQCPHDIKFINGEANTLGWDGTDANSGIGYYGSCCAEMDIWEANSISTAYTPHACDEPGLYRCEGTACGDNATGERYDGVCDKDGCDFNPYRLGDRTFYGPGSDFTVDTTRPMTVVTQFLTSDGTDAGELVEIRRLYVQDGVVHANPTISLAGKNFDSITDEMCSATKVVFEDVDDHSEKGGLRAMGEALDRGMVLVMSIWDDASANMLWLDSLYPTDEPAEKPGVARGTCSTDSGVPSETRAQFPNSQVLFANVKYGAIGSTFDGGDGIPTPAPTPSTPATPAPTPAPSNPPSPAPSQPTPAPTPAPSPSPAPTPAPSQPTPAPTDPPTGPGYCTWNGCTGRAEGGPWCNESSARCSRCGGNWCIQGEEPAPPAGCTNVVRRWGKCGGRDQDYSSHCCEAGSTCVYSNPYYSQCRPSGRKLLK